MTPVPASTTLSALVADQAARTPEAAALVAGDVRWSYADLDTAAGRAAAALGSLGLGPGERVGLLAANTAEWPAVVFGAHRIGARVDAFNTWAKAWDLEHLLGSSECGVLVTMASVRSTDLLGELRKLLPEPWDAPAGTWRSERFPALRHVVVLGGAEVPVGAQRWDDLVASAEPVEASEPDPGSTAFVLYTSGSTATPKAVPLVHRDLILNGFHIGERMGLTGADRVWLGSPLFWSFGAANALMATITHGACLVLQEQFSAPDAARLLATERCTAAYLLPSMVDALLPVAEQVRAVKELRTGLTIGRPEEVRRLADDLGIAEICNIYGSTETYGNCCVTAHDTPLETRLVSQGRPLPGVELRVVDDAGELRHTDATGELHVRGRIMPGYLGDPEATASAMTDDGWYRTGDRVHLRQDGAIEFRSRLTDMIKTSGINVSPAEIESYLCRHEQVAAAAVVGAPHPARGEVAVAFVTTRGEGVDAETLRSYCREGIAGYKVPWEIVVVPGLPTTGTGKVMRRALIHEATERVAAAEVRSNAAGNTTARTNNWGRWGADDEVGALNLLDQETVLAAVGHVRTGRVIHLAQPIGPGTTVPPHRSRPQRFMNRDAGDYAAGARSPDGFRFAEDTVQFASHTGTHLDALAHAWTGDELYNGHPASSVRSTRGAARCGADKLRPIVTRGLLVDLVAVHGGPLPRNWSISRDELATACRQTGVIPGTGDAVLIRTGWWERHHGSPEYHDNEPGLSDDAAAWLAEQDITLVGADNYAVEVQPSPEGTTFPAHLTLLHHYGIPILENLDLTDLAAAAASSFLFIAAPVLLQGSTASPLTPLAVL